MEDLSTNIKRYVTLKAQIEALESELEPLRDSLLNELKNKKTNRIEQFPFYIENRIIHQERASKKDFPVEVWNTYSKQVTISQLIVSTIKEKSKRSRSRSPTKKVQVQ
jgi:hypothetical protein